VERANDVSGTEPLTEHRLAVRSLSKTYAGVSVVDGVDLLVGAGQVIGLVGHNGAGKSTLAKAIVGLVKPDDGQIFVDGREILVGRVSEAADAGIALVSQVNAIIPNLSVYDNIRIGYRAPGHRKDQEASNVGFEVVGDERQVIVEIAEQLGIDSHLDQLGRSLSPVGEKMAMLARAILRSPKLIILDEPTAAFSIPEVELLTAMMDSLKRKGVSFVLVSHRLREVAELCSEVVVMAQGRVVANVLKEIVSHETLADLIAQEYGGKHRVVVESAVVAPSPLETKHALSVHADGRSSMSNTGVALQCTNLTFAPKINSVTMTLNYGEVLGLTGLVGSGRSTLLKTLVGYFGWRNVEGSVQFNGSDFEPRSIGDAYARGIAFLPEDRAHNSLLVGMNVRENMTMPTLRKFLYKGTPFVNRRREMSQASHVLSQLSVYPPDAIKRDIRELSGGNQQKALLGRWLFDTSNLVILDEPTEGVDGPGRDEIYRVIRSFAANGAAVLVSSSDITEVVEVSDRVLVMRDGTIAGEFSGQTMTPALIAKACFSSN
jgi:ABC-type sugar transport system ATPase subunit